MAEGGFDPPNKDGLDEGNPFSFQKFVKVQSTNNGEQKEPGENQDQPQRTRREENPFSFKQFLKKDTLSKPKVYSLVVDDISETCGGSRSRTLTPDVTTDLPDFVQDHFIPDSAQDSRQPKCNANNEERNSFRLSSSFDLHQPVINQAEHSFPDLTSDDRIVVSDEPSDISQNGNIEPVNLDIENHNNVENGQDVSVLSLSLPDFLSDGPMLNHLPQSDENRTFLDSTSQLECPHCHSLQSNNRQTELEELRRMHSTALQELDNSRALAENAARKIRNLEVEVEGLKSKEVVETAALENMVHQVEQNLQLTKQRAVKAENNVSKLKQEVKTLQSQVKFLTSENELLKVGAQTTSIPAEIRAKANNLSTMMNCAASDAETNIKQLLRGVEHLRFLSTVVQNIDKVSDASATEDDK